MLHMGPPKTAASLRTVALPRFVVEDLSAHLAGRATEAFVFTAPGWTVRANLFRARVLRPATGWPVSRLRIHATHTACHVARGRANPQESRPGRALLVDFTLARTALYHGGRHRPAEPRAWTR